jgi:hypothetical protein
VPGFETTTHFECNNLASLRTFHDPLTHSVLMGIDNCEVDHNDDEFVVAFFFVRLLSSGCSRRKVVDISQQLGQKRDYVPSIERVSVECVAQKPECGNVSRNEDV